MKVYVGCSLTQSPDDFKRDVGALKDALRSEYEVMDFVGTTAGTPRDVYLWDIHECVAACDAFIAVCDHPSIGLGYELSVAVEKLGKPTLALAHSGATVSRMVLGIEQPHYRFERYGTAEELTARVRSFLAGVRTPGGAESRV